MQLKLLLTAVEILFALLTASLTSIGEGMTVLVAVVELLLLLVVVTMRVFVWLGKETKQDAGAVIEVSRHKPGVGIIEMVAKGVAGGISAG